jgi:hypothetical protein
MPSYEVTSPDGKKWVVDAPEGATQEQVLSYAKAQWSAKPQEPQAPQASVQMGRTISRELPRQAGLTLRAGVQGLASLPGIANDALGGLYNTAANAIQGQGKGFRFQPTSFALGNVMDAAGVAKPETPDERVVQDATTLGFGALSGSGAAQWLANRAPQAATVAREVLTKLAANPLAQVVSGVGAGGAGGATREAGGGAGAQFLASLEKRKLYDTFEKVQEAVRPVQEKYNMLFNDTDNFLEENPGVDAEQILDIMDSHVRRV